MFVKPTLLQALGTTDAQINDASKKIATGKKINSALDDPITFNRITTTKASVSETGIKLNTLEYGIDRLDARDSVLSSMQDTVMRFQELATMASTGIHKLTDILPEMRSLKESMISLANTSDASGLMFAGTAINVTPFVKDPVTGAVSYAGSTAEHMVEVEGVRLNGSINGAPFIAVFDAMDNVINSMTASTAPSAAMVADVKGSLETLISARTNAAAQAAGANMIKAALTARSDRESGEVSKMEDADITKETIKLTEGQKHYEAILKITGMELNRRRLMDFL